MKLTPEEKELISELQSRPWKYFINQMTGDVHFGVRIIPELTDALDDHLCDSNECPHDKKSVFILERVGRVPLKHMPFRKFMEWFSTGDIILGPLDTVIKKVIVEFKKERFWEWNENYKKLEYWIESNTPSQD